MMPPANIRIINKIHFVTQSLIEDDRIMLHEVSAIPVKNDDLNPVIVSIRAKPA